MSMFMLPIKPELTFKHVGCMPPGMTPQAPAHWILGKAHVPGDAPLHCVLLPTALPSACKQKSGYSVDQCKGVQYKLKHHETTNEHTSQQQRCKKMMHSGTTPPSLLHACLLACLNAGTQGMPTAAH